jgi:hypothetical protein
MNLTIILSRLGIVTIGGVTSKLETVAKAQTNTATASLHMQTEIDYPVQCDTVITHQRPLKMSES